MLALSKHLKGWMQGMPLKFQEVRFKTSRGQTRMSKSEDPERIFLIQILKFGIHDGQFTYRMSYSLVSN